MGRMGKVANGITPLIKGVCLAFGIQDVVGQQRNRTRAHSTNFTAVWNAFLNVSNPEQTCEDRGQRMVTAFPEVDNCSYHLPRGYAHDKRVQALEILKKHMKEYEAVENFNQYDMTEAQRKALPEWLTEEPNEFWTGGLP